jgi:gluconolactonase
MSQEPSPPGTLVSLDPRFDALVPKTAKLEKLADGFSWVEGPAWDQKAGAILFSDIPNNVVHKWKDGEGLSEFLRPAGYTGSKPFTGREPGSNGLTWDRERRLVLCQHGDRRIARLDAPGRFTTLVDRYEGKRLNSPNDLVFKSNGDLYFTDPPYGLPGTFTDPGRELEIVQLIGEGMRNGHIAERLFISPSTVRNHVTSILDKLDLSDRFDLAIYAFRHGIVRFS